MAPKDAAVGRSRIFISYRRADSEQAAARLAEDLRRHFAPEQVFQDFASIDPGADFVEAVQRGLDTCAAVLVVIGTGWLGAADKQGRRRLDLPDDWVRHEVAESLKHPDVRVFPVLVSNAEMPAAEDLAEPLRSLTRRQAFPLTVRHWANDVAELVGHLKRVPGLAGPASEVSPSAGPRVEPASKRSLPWKPLAAVVGSLAVLALFLFVARKPDTVPVQPRAVAEEKQAPEPETPVPKSTKLIEAPSTLLNPSPTPLLKTPKEVAPAPKPGDSFRDCDACPEMVVIPAGSFTMGSPNDEKGRSDDEGPQHKVTIARAFAVGKYEVTFDEWETCVAASACTQKPKDRGWGRGKRPVINVSWNDAQEYIGWLSKKTGKDYRLLSEAEWEYAARAGTKAARFSGDDPDQACRYSNVFDKRGKTKLDLPWKGHNCDDGYAETSPVGSFKPNAFGPHDMIGNVWEWTQDCWNESYKGAPLDGRPWESGDCGRRVARGGSWDNVPDFARSASRGGFEPGDRGNNLGFRLARTL
jgi:formylglycine-generating enzyme required for sulfatase activity